jgi:hypothetical protein
VTVIVSVKINAIRSTTSFISAAITASHYRAARAQAFQTWAEVTGVAAVV